MAQPELNKSLGFVALIALGVSGVIGSSWIYTNGSFFDKYGAGGMIFGLALGAIGAAFVALSYAQLTTLFPRAGGEVVFGYTILGRRVGFVVGWLLIGTYVSSMAFYFAAFGMLLDWVVPTMHALPVFSIAGQEVTLPVLVSGFVLALIFYLLNYFGVSLGAQVQTVLFAALVIIGLALVVVGFAHGSPSNFWPPFAPDQAPVPNIVRFVVPGMTYMAGFGLVAALAEDAKIEPGKIGRVVVVTVLAAGGFYCLVLTASAWVLPWQQVAQMEQGTIQAYTQAGFPLLGWGAFAIAILGMLTSFLGLYMATSRIVVAMARVNLLPACLARIHPRHRTPTNALLFLFVIIVALGCLGKAALTWFLDTGGIYLGLVWVIVVICQLRLRVTYPHLQAQSKVKAGFLPVIGAIGAALVIVLALWPGTNLSLVWPAEYIIVALWIVLGAVLYALNKPIPDHEALSRLLGEYYENLEPGGRK